jgi:hypothetical protein
MLLLQRQAGSTHLRARISSQGLEASVTRSAITTAVRYIGVWSAAVKRRHSTVSQEAIPSVIVA